MIDYPHELLKISNNPKVFISRRALKHFVERRREELKGRDAEEILYKLYFTIEHTEVTVQNYDEIIIEGKKSIYSKVFPELRASIRVVVEKIHDHFEIKSIHFQKYKKAID